MVVQKRFLLVSALVAALQLSTPVSAVVEDNELCLGECNEDGTECTFHVGLNIFAGETGYYEVEGCSGVQPTLGMKFGVKYTFDQRNVTNWFHPLGFAYGPDGVYGLNVELEPTAVDPVSSLECGTEGNYCQFPHYMLNGERLCTDCSDPEDFGLDEYEGVYFHGGRDDWIDAGNFSVQVTITDPATTELFYFCHIHNQMSGRIKVLDANGRQKNKADLVPIPYEYHQISEFDRKCGTFNASQFRPGSKCQGLTFVCGSDEHYLYGQCLNAIDCAMHELMRTPFIDKDPTTTFMHQMIPHHQNAVNMAKILLKYNPPSLRCGTSYDGRRRLMGLSPLRADDDDGGFGDDDDDGFDEEFCHDGNDDGGVPAETLLWEIINGQNSQITFMRAWLKDNLQPSNDFCKAEPYWPSEAIIALAGLGAVTAFALIGTGYFVYTKNKIQKMDDEKVKGETDKEVAEEVAELVPAGEKKDTTA